MGVCEAGTGGYGRCYPRAPRWATLEGTAPVGQAEHGDEPGVEDGHGRDGQDDSYRDAGGRVFAQLQEQHGDDKTQDRLPASPM